MKSETMKFECEQCGQMFSDTFFGVNKGMERLHFFPGDRHPEVEIVSAENVANYCWVFRFIVTAHSGNVTRDSGDRDRG